jgi:malate dehydrogenase
MESIKNATLDVPVKLGKNGIEEIVELELNEEEKASLYECAKDVQELIA